MKARFKHWHLPVRSFYCKRLYRDVSTRWTGGNLLYLCLLLAVCLIPAANNRVRHAKSVIDDKAEVFLMQIPPMRLAEGKLTVDAPQPYSIIEDNETVLLIDTTGQTDSLADVPALALLTADRLYVRNEQHAYVTYELARFKEAEFDRAVAETIIEQTKRWIAPTWYLVSYLINVVLFLAAAFGLGGLALALARKLNRTLDYWAGVRLAVVALTPPMILAAVLETVQRPLMFLAYAALAVAYLFLAVSSAKKNRPPVETVEGGETSGPETVVTFPVSEDRPYTATTPPED